MFLVVKIRSVEAKTRASFRELQEIGLSTGVGRLVERLPRSFPSHCAVRQQRRRCTRLTRRCSPLNLPPTTSQGHHL